MRVLLYPTVALLAGCSGEQKLSSYVCEEPLEKYLSLARANIANDYEVERSSQVLTVCPEKGFHRRYTFSFHPSAIVSKRPVDASVVASWCGDAAERHTDAKLSYSRFMLVFQFKYPWSTATGKYPPTEFRLNNSSMKGGFFEELDWSCSLEQQQDSGLTP